MSGIGSLCTGIGGLDLAAAKVFDAEHHWFAENDPHASSVLADRFPGVPNLGSVTDVMAAPSPVDIITAGFPCQDLSYAGKGQGLAGERSGLWFNVLDWIKLLTPEWVAIENVPALKTRGLDVVLQGLVEAGYRGAWCFYRSGYRSKNPSNFAHVNGCHQRKRLFILATPGYGGFTELIPPFDADTIEVTDLLATPTAWLGRRPSHSDMSNPSAFGSGSGRELVRDIADMLPTPTSRDHKGRNQRDDDTCLPGAVILNSWGKYASAVDRWADTFGHEAPEPVVDGRLNPQLPEWMMGYPKGWVTDLDGSRTQQLKRLGNAVQPQVAHAALLALKAAL